MPFREGSTPRRRRKKSRGSGQGCNWRTILGMRVALRWTLVFMGAAAVALLWLKVATRGGSQGKAPATRAGSPSVFTPAHRTARAALADFLGWRPAPVQPVAFPHYVHIQKQISCDSCHAGVNQGPLAGLPSVKLCMVCHKRIATDRPEIKRATAYAERGEEIPWQRVYGFMPSAHVKFNHAPHIRAGVDCAICHGDLAKQTVVVRAVNLNMGYCVDCHKTRKASTECITCHF